MSGYGAGSSLGGPIPVYLAADPPQPRDRITAALRIIWVIPQWFALIFVGIAALVVTVIGWFAALVSGELPEFAEEFLSGVLRWSARVGGYFYFLTDQYPPFSLDVHDDYPIRISIPPRAKLNRLAVLFRIILAIPAGIVSTVVGAGALFIAFAAWVCILVSGVEPIPLYEVLRVFIRYQMRVSAYFTMLTAEYPWGIMGDASAQDAAPEASGWSLVLSPGGRTAMIVTIVIGVLYELFGKRT
jgi:hypothetical protein